MNSNYSNEKVLIVDDQKEILNSLSRLFKNEYQVITANSGEEAIKVLKQIIVAVILSDQRMPRMDGTSFLQKAKDIQPDAIRILITGYSDIEATVEAVNKAQIFQYVSKPFEPEELKQIINRAIDHYRLSRENKKLHDELIEKNKLLQIENEALVRQVEHELDLGNIIGSSPAMIKVFKLIKKVAKTPTTVLLEGETGTGKELTAKMIHHNSDRSKNMFIAQNCGAIPDTLLQSELFGHEKGAFTGAIQTKKGLFEMADNGTIFLDEIADTTPALQLGLLRVLQEGEIKPLGSHLTKQVNVRVIAATNKNLQEEVLKGNFREDLFYRLNVFPIILPPLRNRKEDIPDLINYFVDKYARRIGKSVKKIDDSVIELLLRADFPGNIRELENEVERMITLIDDNGILTADLLSPRFHIKQDTIDNFTDLDGNLKEIIEKIERKMIENALNTTRGNVLQSAAKLGVSRVGLHKMLKRYEILPEKFKN
ncbi:MAG: sigma-54-dependent Fis family transcriptional regulator [Calditrichaceae bacterium]|nr:sigma-54-dependent Fis family transcriptional regulator [Calditrichaceae bacterium]MBN2709575.1 sigma-54-dependent Fis family transcriptional regulator [Calditrichaceae bacterium]